MELIDAQVHVVDHDRPERPWAQGRVPAPGVSELIVPAEQMIAAMDRAGVDGAIIVATRHYGFDATYALEAAARFPSRFRVVCLADRHRADPEEYVERWSAEPYGVGMRVLAYDHAERAAFAGGGYERILGAAERCAVPITVYAPHDLAAVAANARAHPQLQLVVDHLGVAVSRTSGIDPFQNLDAVLELAGYPNVAVKLTGVPSLASGDYPFVETLGHVRRLIDGFGPSRLVWGTDWTRVTNATYEQGVRFFTDTSEVTDTEKRQIAAVNARRIFGWSGGGAATP